MAGALCGAAMLGGCNVPQCGYDLAGVSIQLPDGVTTTIRVGQGIVVTALLDRPVDLVCPESPTNRQGYFRRVKWSWRTDGPLAVRLVACPCTLETSYEKEGRTFNVTTASARGQFSFEIVGRAPGTDWLAVIGLIERGGCPFLAPGDPFAECGLYVESVRLIRVIE